MRESPIEVYGAFFYVAFRIMGNVYINILEPSLPEIENNLNPIENMKFKNCPENFNSFLWKFPFFSLFQPPAAPEPS